MRRRNDGKPARRPLGGLPAGSPPPMAASDGSGAPSWYELVLGPKPGSPAEVNTTKTFERRQDLGQVIVHEPYKVEFPAQFNGLHRKERRIRARASGMHGEYHDRLVRRTPKALQVPGSRLGMALIRQTNADRRRHERKAARG